ncbi:MAG: hypothetical protein IT320_25545 [Anaerolineae bacterium]|nr:hypothetical protein [Anaerolineae bacterium]
METETKLIDQRLRWFLFCLVLGVYLLVYIPQPDSADGNAVLAVTASTLRFGTPDISVLAADDARFEFDMSRMGTFGVDGALYSKKGVAPSIALIPLVLAAQTLPWLPIRATAMLLNPLLTALAAALLYTLVRRADYRPRTALAVGLVYGLATLALVYTKTLFGEPLAALALLAAALWIVQWRAVGRRRDLLLAGAALAVAVGVNMTYLLMPLVFGVFAFAPPRRQQMPRFLMDGLVFLTPILLALAGLALYNWARFGSPVDTGYHFEAGEGFTRPIPAGLFGLFLSPYRGLFWYAPVLLLAVPGWWMLRQRTPRLAWFTLNVVALQSLTYAGWWSWHGGIVWGTRFLVPVLPLMALWLAPLVDHVLDPATRRWWLTVTFAVLTLASAIVQALGALLSPYPYYGDLVVHYYTGVVDSLVTGLADRVMFDPGLSPVIGHARLLLQGQPLDPAWLRSGVDGVHLLAALALMGAAFLLLRRRRPALIGALVCLAVLNVVAARQLDDPKTQAVLQLEQTLEPPTTTVFTTAFYEDALLDAERLRPMTMNAPVAADDRLERPLWEHALQVDARLWYVTWFSAQDPDNWQEHDLWMTGAFAYERAVDGHRALLFYLRPPESERHPAGFQFGPFRLEAYGVAPVEDGLIVDLDWLAAEAPGADYTWFVHVLDAQGQIVAQQDRAPQGGIAPTSVWEHGRQVTDRLYFPIDKTRITGDWRLRVGWIDPTSGELLETTSADGNPVADRLILLPLDFDSGG